VLLRLLVDANRTVSAEQLIDALWQGEPPATARTALHVNVSKLRRLFAVVGADTTAIATSGSDYLLCLDGHVLDAQRFEMLLAEARSRQADGDDEAALSGFQAALGMWRGRALGDDVRDPASRGWADSLDELRRRAEEEYGSALLDSGRSAVAFEWCQRLVIAEPLREHRWRLLMLALYRQGRQAEALRAYQDVRRLLADEVGLEPGLELQQLERAILRHDPALGSDPPWSSPPRTETTARPAPLTPLIGRADDVRMIPACSGRTVSSPSAGHQVSARRAWPWRSPERWTTE
jgi:DNA-binding SARP family transcriptional activator